MNLDTIVAPATPSGTAALAILRISGPQALAIIAKLFPARNLLFATHRSIHVGILQKDGLLIDEVVVTVFRGPHSYTGDDLVEVSLHGSPIILAQAVEVLLDTGCRLGLPGEFTQRAFLNGKMDLLQAESVADLISASTLAAKNAALRSLKGSVSKKLSFLREKLVEFVALLELELDFSEEDVEFASRSGFIALVQDLLDEVGKLLGSYRLGNFIKNGVGVSIVGLPNAGKSTLLNTLLNEDRAIVSEIPGTTRDIIEELFQIKGLLFRLIDTAGIRQNTSDIIERFGIEKSWQKIKTADVVVVLFDVSLPFNTEIVHLLKRIQLQEKEIILVANKIDLSIHQSWNTFLDNNKVLLISAKSSTDCTLLQDELVSFVLRNGESLEQDVVTNGRHFEALSNLNNSLFQVKTGLLDGLSADLLSADVKTALIHLGLITGTVSHNELLDFIFSKFCIGK